MLCCGFFKKARVSSKSQSRPRRGGAAQRSSQEERAPHSIGGDSSESVLKASSSTAVLVSVIIGGLPWAAAAASGRIVARIPVAVRDRQRGRSHIFHSRSSSSNGRESPVEIRAFKGRGNSKARSGSRVRSQQQTTKRQKSANKRGAPSTRKGDAGFFDCGPAQKNSLRVFVKLPPADKADTEG